MTASVSGMLAEETAEVVIAHTLACLLDVFSLHAGVAVRLERGNSM